MPLLTGGTLQTVPQRIVVLQRLESQPIHDALLNRCKSLVAEGLDRDSFIVHHNGQRHFALEFKLAQLGLSGFEELESLNGFGGLTIVLALAEGVEQGVTLRKSEQIAAS